MRPDEVDITSLYYPFIVTRFLRITNGCVDRFKKCCALADACSTNPQSNGEAGFRAVLMDRLNEDPSIRFRKE